MDYSLVYKKMCYKADELQENWQLNDGDMFILKASYCSSCKENLCDGCLDMDNIYSIGGNHYNRHYLFNPHLCVRGDGCRLNDTAASILVTNKQYIDDIQPFTTHVDDVCWLPRQEDLQQLVINEEGYSLQGLMAEFHNYVFSKSFDTLEQYWIAFTMDFLYGKRWNGEKWILIK